MIIRRLPSWRRPRWMRMPSLTTLIFLILLLQAGGSIGIFWVTADTNHIVSTTDAETEQVVDHRVRNELSHACIVEFLEGLRDGVNNVIEGRSQLIVVENTCPPPLTEGEIRALRRSHLSERDE